MTYAVFTSSEKKFRDACTKIFDGGIYKGYKTLPMVVWTRHRILLKDNTEISWINTQYDLQDQLRGRRFQHIHVLDGVTPIQLLESVYPSWNPV